SFDPGWRDFCEGFTPGVGPRAPAEAAEPAAPEAAEPAAPEGGDGARPGPVAVEQGQALTGAGARIAENMEASLAIPTATSVRTVPARLLEENRRVVNRFLGASGGGKVSFTHLIGWAIVRELGSVP